MQKTLNRTAAACAIAAACLTATPAYAAHHAEGNRPHYCARNAVGNQDPGSGTNAATLGIRTKVSSNVANPAAPPVLPNTPANTNASNIDSTNPGAHVKNDRCASARPRLNHHTHAGATT